MTVEFTAGKLREALEESIAKSKSLEPVDAGLVAAARTVADRIDDAVATADGQELTKALYLIPHLTNLLREMLATPAARVNANVGKGGESGKAARLTALRGGRAAQG